MVLLKIVGWENSQQKFMLKKIYRNICERFQLNENKKIMILLVIS